MHTVASSTERSHRIDDQRQPCSHVVNGCIGCAGPTRHRLAYDGKGNYLVRSEADIDAAAAALGGYEAGLYAEKFAPFVKELAVMVVRRWDGRGRVRAARVC